jgi:hypothetical protein
MSRAARTAGLRPRSVPGGPLPGTQTPNAVARRPHRARARRDRSIRRGLLLLVPPSVRDALVLATHRVVLRLPVVLPAPGKEWW